MKKNIIKKTVRSICFVLLVFSLVDCKKKTTVTSHTVRYEITNGSSGFWLAIQYSSITAAVNSDYEEIDFQKSWTKEVTLKTGDRVYFTAQESYHTDSFTINVYVDGKLTETANQTFGNNQFSSSPIGPGPSIDFILN